GPEALQADRSKCSAAGEKVALVRTARLVLTGLVGDQRRAQLVNRFRGEVRQLVDVRVAILASPACALSVGRGIDLIVADGRVLRRHLRDDERWIVAVDRRD